jgi:hypothetical protein
LFISHYNEKRRKTQKNRPSDDFPPFNIYEIPVSPQTKHMKRAERGNTRASMACRHIGGSDAVDRRRRGFGGGTGRSDV